MLSFLLLLVWALTLYTAGSVDDALCMRRLAWLLPFYYAVGADADL